MKLASNIVGNLTENLAEQVADPLTKNPLDEADVARAAPPNSSVGQAAPSVLARQLEQISAAAGLFSLQLDHTQLLQEIARQAVDILRTDQCNVYKALEHGLTLGARHSAHDEVLAVDRSPHADVDWVARYLHPKLSAGISSSDGSLRNAICIPLVGTQNRVLGVIEVIGKRNGGLFSDGDVRVLLCLSRVATTAVDRALLFDRIEQWTRSMETLLSFNATVNQHLEPQEMVRQLVANVTGFLNADGGAAGIVFNVEGTPVAECDSVYFDSQWHAFPRQWRAKEGIPGTVLDTEFPFLVNDYQTHALADQELVRRFHVKSCICVPIKNATERVLGFFKLHRLAGKAEFTWQDAAFLESLGNTAAVAIENARLVQSLDRKNRQVKRLSEAHVRRLEEERKHIARELHDETGQVLIGLKLRLQVLSGLLSEQQEPARRELAELRSQVGDATAKLKDLAKRLRPPTLDELGFEATLRQLLAEYRRQVGDSTAFFLDFSGAPQIGSEGLTALYRITQESLTNIVKHAGATVVHIRLSTHQGWQLFTIEDNGCGFDPDRLPQSNAIDNSETRLGLVGMHERVKMIGGQLTIRSKLGEGTHIEVAFQNYGPGNEEQDTHAPGR